MTQTSPSRPRIMLDDDREAWYAEQMAKCKEGQKKTEDELSKWWKDADGSWRKSEQTQWEITSKEVERDGDVR